MASWGQRRSVTFTLLLLVTAVSTAVTDSPVASTVLGCATLTTVEFCSIETQEPHTHTHTHTHTCHTHKHVTLTWEPHAGMLCHARNATLRESPYVRTNPHTYVP
jgi:hypothetical protein